MTAVFAVGLLLMAVATVVTVGLLMHPELLAHSPLERYGAAVGRNTCVVTEVNLQALEESPEFADAAKNLRQQFAEYLHDLDLQPGGWARAGRAACLRRSKAVRVRSSC